MTAININCSLCRKKNVPKFTVNELLKITRGKLINGSLSFSAGENINGICIDTRILKKGQFFIALQGNNFDGCNFVAEAFKKGASGVIIDCPFDVNKLGNDRLVIQVKNTAKCLGNIAGYWRRKFPVPLVAITGSNGKTTTKDMVRSILSAKFNILSTRGNFNNHIGLPLTLLELEPRHEMICVEMGTSSFGEIKYLCRIASPLAVGVITNIQRAHLLNFGDLKGVLRAKMELLDYLPRQGVAVLNIDDSRLAKALNKIKTKTLTYGINNNQADITAGNIFIHPKGIKFQVTAGVKGRIIKEDVTLPIPGYQNVYNALAAISIGLIFNIPLKVSARRLARFKSPHLRNQVSQIRGITIINDTYNANPDSTTMAVYTLGSFMTAGKKIAVLGDMLELGPLAKAAHREIGRLVAQSNISNLLTVGKMAKYVAEGAIKSGMDKKQVFTACDKKNIIKQLLKTIAPKDVVLVKGSRAMKMEEIVKALETRQV
jgi:UDP-N-acetylmuramoyl-tripeptide--D-alanyl-D-alanine ligase